MDLDNLYGETSFTFMYFDLSRQGNSKKTSLQGEPQQCTTQFHYYSAGAGGDPSRVLSTLVAGQVRGWLTG